MIVVSRVSKSFSDVVALADVSFEMKKGVNVLIGPNGAGKTTTLKCIAGIIKPDSGSIRIFEKPPEKVKERIAFLSEDRRGISRLKVKDYEQLMALLYPTWDGRLLRKLLSHFQIPRQKAFDALSAGLKTLLLFSVAISSGADVLLFDEPTQHLDPVKISDIQSLIRELGEEKIIVLSTHHLEEVESFADRMFVINEGRVIYYDDVDHAKETHRVVQQNEISESDEIIHAVESGWLIRTEKDKGRYPSLREIVLAYLKKSSSSFLKSLLEMERESS